MYIIKGDENVRFFVFTDKGIKNGPYYAGNSFFIAFAEQKQGKTTIFHGRNVEVGWIVRGGKSGFGFALRSSLYETTIAPKLNLKTLPRKFKNWECSEAFYADSHIREISPEELTQQYKNWAREALKEALKYCRGRQLAEGMHFLTELRLRNQLPSKTELIKSGMSKLSQAEKEALGLA